MNNYNTLPIFCDNCATLAFAELDAAPLCEKCLFSALKRSQNSPSLNRIEPLRFAEPSGGALRFASSDDMLH